MKNTCDVCQRNDQKIAGVASSALGPFSLMYCEPCARNGAEPKEMIEATIEDLGGIDNIHKSYLNSITYFEDGEYLSMKTLRTKLTPGKR
jgi:hypothetical protein